MWKRFIASLVCIAFVLGNLQYVYAEDFSIDQLPVPGSMVNVSSAYSPLSLKGLIVNPRKPLEFQFIVDTGKGPQDSPFIKEEANQLVKYFLAGLTIPEGELWVNLSPYEKNRITTQFLGQTELGRDLLAQDYILKQLTASLIYPEKDLGKQFWSRVYAKAQQQFGTTDIPVNTFNKVWILPDQAQVFENGPAAYVTRSTLKVMLDEDYLAKQKHTAIRHDTGSIGSNIVREIVLPEIVKEVNTGRNFAPLRQIYDAMILAKWYKETIQNGLLDAIYTNKEKISGVDLSNPAVKEQIYQRYLQAYKKGVFNYIKEDPAPDGQTVLRQYFSGGITKLEPDHVDTHGDASMISVRGALLALTISLSAMIPSGSLAQQNTLPQGSAESSETEEQRVTKLENLINGQFYPDTSFDDEFKEIGRFSIPDIVRILRDTKSPPSDPNFTARRIARVEIIQYLGKIREKRAVTVLTEVLGNTDEFVFVRAAAADALGDIGDKQAIPVLSRVSHEKILSIADDDFHKSVVRALDKLDANWWERQSELEHWFWLMGLIGVGMVGTLGVKLHLNHTRSERMIKKIRTLAQEKNVPEIIIFLNDEDLNVRVEAISALGKLGGEKAKEALAKALKNESDLNIKIILTIALDQLGDTRGKNWLLGHLSSPKPSALAALALGEMGDKRGLEWLVNHYKTLPLEIEKEFSLGYDSSYVGSGGSSYEIIEKRIVPNLEAQVIRSYIAKLEKKFNIKVIADSAMLGQIPSLVTMESVRIAQQMKPDQAMLNEMLNYASDHQITTMILTVGGSIAAIAYNWYKAWIVSTPGEIYGNISILFAPDVDHEAAINYLKSKGEEAVRSILKRASIYDLDALGEYGFEITEKSRNFTFYIDSLRSNISPPPTKEQVTYIEVFDASTGMYRNLQDLAHPIKTFGYNRSLPAYYFWTDVYNRREGDVTRSPTPSLAFMSSVQNETVETVESGRDSAMLGQILKRNQDAAMLAIVRIAALKLSGNANAIAFILNDAESKKEYKTYNAASNALNSMGDLRGGYIYERNLVNDSVEDNDANGYPYYRTIGRHYEWSKVKNSHDQAMLLTSKVAKNSEDLGGIDLNQIAIKRTGNVIKMNFDPVQLNKFLQGGFEGFTPVIISIRSISSPLPLMGVQS